MVKSIKKEALDPSSVKISDDEVVFKNDSICVIDFVLRQANREGGMDKSNREYIYLKAYDGAYERFLFISNKPFKERIEDDIKAEKIFQKLIAKSKYGNKMSIEDYFVLYSRNGNKIK